MKRLLLLATLLFTLASMPAAALTTSDIIICRDGTRLRPAPGRWYKVASRTDDYWPGFGSRTPGSAVLTPEPGMPQALGFADWQALYDDISSSDGTISQLMLRSSDSAGSPAGGYNSKILPAQGLAPEGIVSMAPGRRLWIVFDGLSPLPTSGDSTAKMYLYIPHGEGPVLVANATDYRWDKTVELHVSRTDPPGRWVKVASRTDDYWPGFSEYSVRSHTPGSATLTPEPGMPQALGFDDIRSPDGTISQLMLRSFPEGGNGHANSQHTQILPAQGLAPEGIVSPEGFVSMAENRLWIVFDELAPPPRSAHPRSKDHVGGMYLYIPRGEGPALAFGWNKDYTLWDRTVELYVQL